MADTDDDELDLSSLLASLASVQEQKASLRLTERNTVELVQKLFERNLFVRPGERRQADKSSNNNNSNGNTNVIEVKIDNDDDDNNDNGNDKKGIDTTTSSSVELLHTLDGKEYMTFDRLVTEVNASLRRKHGRVSLSELPDILTVDVAHCERAAHALVSTKTNNDNTTNNNNDDDIMMIQDELLTSSYFDELANEVAETLYDTGMDSLYSIIALSSLLSPLSFRHYD